MPNQPDSGSTLAGGTFTDTPPAVWSYWYDVDMLDSLGNEAREPVWFQVTVNSAGATPAISTFTATPSTVNGGATITYALTLSGAVPAGGASVSLSSSATSVIPNATLQMLAGATSGQTTVVARNPATSSPVTITATYGSSSKQATVTVNPNLATAYTLTVNSSNPSSGVGITVSPSDNNGLDAGTTGFALTYNQNTEVILTAPLVAAGEDFSSWSGCDLVLSTLCAVTMTANRTVTASYASTGSVDFGTVSIGQTSAVISLPLTFAGSGAAGSPIGLTQGAAGLDFAVASAGTCKAGTYFAGNSCTVNVTFTPKFVGNRNGAVVMKDSAGNILATAYIHGAGSGPQLSFLPGTQTALHSGFGSPVGVAVDGSGNIYVADSPNNAVYEVLAASGFTSVKSLGGHFKNPDGVAVDGSGNVFVAD